MTDKSVALPVSIDYETLLAIKEICEKINYNPK
jgi:hypothetical protein